MWTTSATDVGNIQNCRFQLLLLSLSVSASCPTLHSSLASSLLPVPAWCSAAPALCCLAVVFAVFVHVSSVLRSADSEFRRGQRLSHLSPLLSPRAMATPSSRQSCHATPATVFHTPSVTFDFQELPYFFQETHGISSRTTSSHSLTAYMQRTLKATSL